MSINLAVRQNTTELFNPLGGKQLRIDNQLLGAWNQLKAASGNSNHWAQCAVKKVIDLKSGRIGKNNIFVQPGQQTKPGTDIFYVTLPGCTLTVQRLDNDAYIIIDLKLDTLNYQMQDGQKTTTGLYRVKKADATRWRADFIQDGRLKSAGNPLKLVGISDGGHKDADEAAELLVGPLKPSASSGGKSFSAFDMHYTHDPEGFGGLVHYGDARRPLDIKSAHGSAIMLADTMENARDIEGVTWVASFGGSAVLTQAMKILADRKITLNEHSAFLHRPGSDPAEATRQAHRLGLDLERNFVKTHPLDVAGNSGQFGMIGARWRNPNDSYKTSHALIDATKQIGNIYGGTVAAVSGLAMAGVSMAVPGFVAPALPALIGMATALGVGIGTLKIGDSVIEGVAPRFYQKHLGKYK